jgi:acetylornithine deacetylase/succinyl-diaminopimelate desuccinylase-like protein
MGARQLVSSRGSSLFTPADVIELAKALVRFGSDVPYLSAMGIPPLVGPGSIHDAHTAHAYVRKNDLRAAVSGYADTAEALLAAPRRG